MYIKIRYPFDADKPPAAYILSCAMILLFISCAISSFNIRIENCRETIFSLSSTNTIQNSSFLKCNIPYEECRCSIISNKLKKSIECITNIQTMTAHILPVISCVLQLYLIYELFSVTGNYSHILRDIFWIIGLFIFIIIAIFTQGNTCLYFKTSDTLFTSGCFLSVIVCWLFLHGEIYYSSRKRGKTYRKRRLVKNNHNREMLTIVIVSWLWHYLVVRLRFFVCHMVWSLLLFHCL